MTTNNDVKAPRPFTLPKHWEAEPFDSNKFKGFTILGDTVSIDCGQYKMPTSDPTKDIAKTLLEAIQAIALAQRQWLKAEGFEFVASSQNCTDVVYRLLHKSGHECTGVRIVLTKEQCGKDHDYFMLTLPNGGSLPKIKHGGSCGGNSHGLYLCESYDLSEIKAFKPISDSQEAWDAVAGVEAWEVVK